MFSVSAWWGARAGGGESVFNIPTNLNRRRQPSEVTQCLAPCIRHVDRFAYRFAARSDERRGKREMLLISQGEGGSSDSGGLGEGDRWGGVGAETEAKMNWMMDKHGERKHTLFLTADERKLKIC